MKRGLSLYRQLRLMWWILQTGLVLAMAFAQLLSSRFAPWLVPSHSKSPLSLQFGEEFRPCKLSRVVCAYPRGNLNVFQFQGTLQAKLFGLLQQHAQGKPVLVFCSTRKGRNFIRFVGNDLITARRCAHHGSKSL